MWAVARRVSQLLLGRDLDLVGEVGAQRAERGRLVRAEALDERREVFEARESNALRSPAPHTARRAVRNDLAVDDLDSLSQRTVGLREDHDLDEVIFAFVLHAPTPDFGMRVLGGLFN